MTSYTYFIYLCQMYFPAARVHSGHISPKHPLPNPEKRVDRLRKTFQIKSKFLRGKKMRGFYNGYPVTIFGAAGTDLLPGFLKVKTVTGNILNVREQALYRVGDADEPKDDEKADCEPTRLRISQPRAHARGGGVR